MDNYRTIEAKLKELEPFKGNSLSAVKLIDRHELNYRVYSYNTLIASKIYSASEGEWFTSLSEKKYSTTTSRHQNLIRRAWGIA
jgi:hypothetical protein